MPPQIRVLTRAARLLAMSCLQCKLKVAKRTHTAPTMHCARKNRAWDPRGNAGQGRRGRRGFQDPGFGARKMPHLERLHGPAHAPRRTSLKEGEERRVVERRRRQIGADVLWNDLIPDQDGCSAR